MKLTLPSGSGGVQQIYMEGGEDWLFRPVVAGYLKAESLLDPNIDLEFIALLNEAIDVQQENVYRLRSK